MIVLVFLILLDNLSNMRNYLYILLISITGIACLLIFLFSDAATVPTFRERNGNISLSAEWLNTKKAIEGLIKSIRLNPRDNKSKLMLAQAYIGESRITGDHAYYDQAALTLLEDVLNSEPGNFEALCCKATILLSQHHFEEGLAIARRAQLLNPESAFVYGLMCDAYVELGNYKAAVEMCDKMVSIRPDIRSYLRISYLREIHGDYHGAMEAAKLAVSAGYPGLEQSEFARMILAHLYECTGTPDSAEFQYKMALLERPGYAFAIAGLGRIEKIKGNYPIAISYFEKASTLLTEYSFTDELTDLYLLNNQPEKARKNAQYVINKLATESTDELNNMHGHYADKELAYAYLKIKDNRNALKHAQLEYERRPDNIDVCEMMAWVHYKAGNYIQANKFIHTALRTNSENPVLLSRAGLIKIKAGDGITGIQLIQKAFQRNPFMADIELKKEASRFLTSAHYEGNRQ